MTLIRNALGLALCTWLLSFNLNAMAVQLSTTTGQVLIYPYYTVNGGYDTYVSVVNTKATAKALKVRFLEGKNSREVMGFNLYLAPNDVWAAAITNSDTGGARLAVNDRSCTSPLFPLVERANFVNFSYSGASSDGEDTTLSRTREGHIEVIEMGEVAAVAIPASGGGTILFNQAISSVGQTPPIPRDCAAVVQALFGSGAFSTLPDKGLTKPTGGLTGTATIINVAEGTSYSYDPVMLAGFRDTPMHTDYGDAAPNLSSASPKTSTVLLEDRVIVSTWNKPGNNAADPVSAVLMHVALTNEFVIDPAIAAGTDWVVTFPTRKFYVGIDPPSGPGSHIVFERPFSNDFWRGGACEPYVSMIYNRQERAVESFGGVPPAQLPAELCFSVNAASINKSKVLKSPDRIATPLAVGVEPGGIGTTVNSSLSPSQTSLPTPDGWISLAFPQQIPLGHRGTIITQDRNGVATRQLTDDAGIKYIGLPVVGFAVQKYVNGNVNGVLSNYGGLFVHKYERQVP